MKIVTYCVGDDRQPRAGALREDGVVDLSSGFPSVLELIRRGSPALEKARSIFDGATSVVEGAELLAPLPSPESIRDCLAFEKHLRQSTAQMVRMKVGRAATLINSLKILEIPKVWYRQPIYYKCNRFSVVGPDADIQWPCYTEKLDYELELAIVIGKKGRDIPPHKACEHIFGYTIYNDFSARDAQLDEMAARLGPAKGKDFDTGNVFGPCLVTADEIGDPYGLTMVARVNGEERGRGSTADMHHRFDAILAHISKSESLYPGEIIASGTVGDGCGLEQGRFLSPGDLVELEIEGIGVLRNRVVR
jgi:2-keto-4-pentenoate hydratase/2-oxohepta-3-ene-1,7-dioic acid hydratase in catechol pathway